MAFAFCGRGLRIDQRIAFNASKPRCGASFSRPNSPAIQLATLALVQGPPSGGGSLKRPPKPFQQLWLQNHRNAAVVSSQISQRGRSKRVVAFEQLLDPSLSKRRELRHLARRMALHQQKKRLKMPRRPYVLARLVTRLQLRNVQMFDKPRAKLASGKSWLFQLSF